MRFKEKKEKENNRKKTYDYLVNEKGLEPHIASGLTANLMQESYQLDRVWEEGQIDDVGSMGVMQWHGGRLSKLYDFHKKQNKEYKEGQAIPLESQLDYIIHEAKTGAGDPWLKKQYQKSFQAKNPEEAALLFSKYVLRPHKDYAHNKKRMQNANKIFNQYQQLDLMSGNENGNPMNYDSETGEYSSILPKEYRATEGFKGFRDPSSYKKQSTERDTSIIDSAKAKIEEKMSKWNFMKDAIKSTEVQFIDSNPQPNKQQQEQPSYMKKGGSIGDKDKDKDRKKLTRKEWEEKYGSDTSYYAHNLDKVDITTGKTIRELVEDASEKYGIDPAFLASTLFTEGLDQYDKFDEKSNPFSRGDYNEYPVSGMAHLGLDTIGDRKGELIRKGLIDPQEYEERAIEIKTRNEKDEEVTSADVKDLGYGIELTAAFLKNENDNIDNYVEKEGIELNPTQRTFFRNVAYNAGLGNAQDMVSSYDRKGYLKNNSFIKERPDQYWKGVHKHAKKRTTAGIGLNEQEGFRRPEGMEVFYEGFTEPREQQTALASNITQRGMLPIEGTESSISHINSKAKEPRERQEVVSNIQPNERVAINSDREIKGSTGQPTIPQAPREKQEVATNIKTRGIMSQDLAKLAVSDLLKEMPNDNQLPKEEEERTTDIGLGDRGLFAYGDTNENISKIQAFLKEEGYYKDKVDSIYGVNTYNAVKDFQKDNEIGVDGIFGEETLGTIERQINKA